MAVDRRWRVAIRLRWIHLAWLLPGIAAIAGLLWIVFTGIQARHVVDRMQAEIRSVETSLRAGHNTLDSTEVRLLQQQASAARAKTSGPAWWLAAHLPWIGRPAVVARGSAQSVSKVATDALPPISLVAQQLADGQLRHRGRVDIAQLSAAQPGLARAAGVVDTVERRVRALPSNTWLPATTAVRGRVVADVTSLSRLLRELTAASREVPRLMGQTAPKRYLVVFENDAVAQGLGGIPQGVGVMTAVGGRLRFSSFGDASLMPRVSTAPKHSVASSLAHSPGWLRSGRSLDFTRDAPDMRRLAAAKFGKRFDGVVALDATGLSLVLDATGPVTTRSGVMVTASSIIDQVEQPQYAHFNTAAQRRTILTQAGQAVAHALVSGRGSSRSLLRAFGQAALERRFVVWTRGRQVERWLRGTTLGGSLPAPRLPLAAVSVDNLSGGLLDFYLQRSVVYDRPSCRAGPATTTVTLRNAVPRGKLPGYVVHPAWTMKSATGRVERIRITTYAAAGTRFTAATVNGHPARFAAEMSHGRPTVSTTVAMRPRRSYRVVFSMRAPAAHDAAAWVVQPLANPQTDAAIGANCGSNSATRLETL